MIQGEAFEDRDADGFRDQKASPELPACLCSSTQTVTAAAVAANV